MKLRRRLFVLAVTAVGAIISFAADIVTLTGYADEAAKRQDWNAAEAYLREALKAEPADLQKIMLLNNIAMYQYYRGEDSLALQTMDLAISIAPNATQLFANRAKMLKSMGKDDTAIKEYTRVIQMDSTNYVAYFDRGYLYLQNRDTAKAFADLEMCKKLRPTDPNTYMILAVAYTKVEEFDKSIENYNYLIDKIKKPEYYNGRAMARLAKGDLAEAAEDIALGLEMDPQEGELYYCRAYLHLLRYENDAARADAQLAIRYGVPEERIQDLFGE